jgi:hypothetical protein
MDQRPRSPRVPVEFPLKIEGTDESGKPFEAEGTAVKISHAGATIVTDLDLPLGSQVTLVQASGTKLAAEVNGSWTDELDGKRRIGIKLLDTNGWFGE